MPGGGELSEGEERELGIGEERDIPGGAVARPHLSNPPVQRQAVPVPERQWPYDKSLLAHGVDPREHGINDKTVHAAPRGGGPGRYDAAPLVPEAHPVPVYIVERGSAGDKLRTASPRHITCPASTAAETARVCGANPRRIRIGLLNEDTATDIRVAAAPGDLTSPQSGPLGGALIPWPANSYTWLETQDELFAQGASGSGTPRLSIIEEFQSEGRAG